MSKKEITLFFEDLSDCIMELYNVDETTAYNAIKHSDMLKIIRDIGSFVLHDSIDYWAKSVWNCYQRRKTA